MKVDYLKAAHRKIEAQHEASMKKEKAKGKVKGRKKPYRGK